MKKPVDAQNNRPRPVSPLIIVFHLRLCIKKMSEGTFKGLLLRLFSMTIQDSPVSHVFV